MSSRLDVDVMVVGGGIAGCCCAALLSRSGLRVALIDSGVRRIERIGEIAAPDLEPLCRVVGVTKEELDRCSSPVHGILSVWGTAAFSHNSAITPTASTGRCLDRRAFDAILWTHAIQSGVVCLNSARLIGRPARDGHRWFFHADVPGKHVSGSAGLVVEATGRSASSAFAICRHRIFRDRSLAIAFRLPSHGGTVGDASRHAFVESCQHGWFYSVTAPAGAQILVYQTDADLWPKNLAEREHLVNSQLSRTSMVRNGFAQTLSRSVVQNASLRDARMSIRRTAAADGWLAIGDCLMALDPLSGQGVVESIRSAIDAAACLTANPISQTSQLLDFVRRTTSRFNRHALLSAYEYRREQRWSASTFWQRRAQAA